LEGKVPWRRRMREVKEQFVDNGHGLARWIAVAYADGKVARGPRPEEIVDGARDCGFAGVLIDTHSKWHGGLFDWLSIEQLESLTAQARSRGLEFALAGRLQINDVPGIGLVSPDIVGIRSAGCLDGIRTNDIDAAAVRRFRDALCASSRPNVAASGSIEPR